MIKIDSESFHYKLYSLNNDAPEPKNLCQYVRWMLLTVFLGALFFVIAVFALGIVLDLPLALIGTYIFGQPFIPFFSPLTMGFSFLFYFILLCVLSVYLLMFPTKKAYKVIAGTPNEPTLTGQWIEAKHRRICPLIEVE